MSYILRSTYYMSIYLHLNTLSNIPSTIVFPTNQNLKLVCAELITEGFLRAICSSSRALPALCKLCPSSNLPTPHYIEYNHINLGVYNRYHFGISSSVSSTT